MGITATLLFYFAMMFTIVKKKKMKKTQFACFCHFIIYISSLSNQNELCQKHRLSGETKTVLFEYYLIMKSGVSTTVSTWCFMFNIDHYISTNIIIPEILKKKRTQNTMPWITISICHLSSKVLYDYNVRLQCQFFNLYILYNIILLYLTI